MKKNLIYWFIGFCDAEGNFQVFPKKRTVAEGYTKTYYNVGYGFHLSLHIRELPLLQYLKKELNLPGLIYVYEHRQEARLAIVKLEDIKYLLSAIFDAYPLINENQRQRYYKLNQGLTLNIKRFEAVEDYTNFCDSKDYIDPIMENNLKILNINSKEYEMWLTGFITGEGNFNIKKIKQKKKIYMVHEFNIEQADKKVIELIKEKLKISPQIIIKNRPNRKTTYEIRISSKKDIANLIELIDRQEIPLLGNKLNQYKIWKDTPREIIKVEAHC